jgi:hypothetical protein
MRIGFRAEIGIRAAAPLAGLSTDDSGMSVATKHSQKVPEVGQ